MPDKMKQTMDEWKSGKLHSGSKDGPVVTNQKQAVAIGLSQQRKADAGGFQHREDVGLSSKE